MLRVGFTGTRRGMSIHQMTTVNKLLLAWKERSPECSLAHGDCVGADSSADYFARRAGYSIIIHPPEDPRLRAFCAKPGDVVHKPLEYHKRNLHIIESVDRLIAAPYANRMVGGTYFTYTTAKTRGLPVYLVRSNGELETYNVG